MPEDVLPALLASGGAVVLVTDTTGRICCPWHMLPRQLLGCFFVVEVVRGVWTVIRLFVGDCHCNC